jgi:photosystem II stability/assembly factor-like uncharacterized protein
MRPMKALTLAMLAVTVAALAPAMALALALRAPAGKARWEPQTSGVTARLRGVSAVSERVAWASGAGGTVLRTADGGATWQKLAVPDAEKLDFRDVDAVSETSAYILSIGPGPASRIYKTTDAGAHWDLQFTNDNPKAFFDAMAFWDAGHGLVMGDSVDGRFDILTTSDGGKTWARVPPEHLPPALPNEGAFAGSGTNIAVSGRGDAWIGTGASTRCRVLRTRDGGTTWTIAETPRRGVRLRRHLFRRLPGRAARDDRGRRLPQGTGRRRQCRRHRGRRRHVDPGQGPRRLPLARHGRARLEIVVDRRRSLRRGLVG